MEVGSARLAVKERIMTDYVKAWQCIGCGRIEAPQTCIGVCEYRKAEFVYAFEHEQVVAQAVDARRRAEALEALVRQLACTTPRRGEWERSFRALQDQARRVLPGLAAEALDLGAPAAATGPPGPAQASRSS
jgi:hypothetical protein